MAHLSINVSRIVCFLALSCIATELMAQGLLLDEHRRLPRPGRPAPEQSTYKIKELIVESRIRDQVARTQVTQTFVNAGARTMEVCFAFPLPYDGAIDQLTFMVDGTEYEGKLMPAKEARSIYEGYIRRNQDPALLEWIGTGMFKTSVFPVPPGAERKVTLKYSQLLRKDQQLTDFLFPLSTAKYTSTPIETLKFDLMISSQNRIKSVYSPTHPVAIQRKNENHAHVKLEAKNRVPANDFRLFFDTNDGKLGASVLTYWPEESKEGFFLMLASPRIRDKSSETPRKTVVFVVDRSGSMSGKKIEQAREALRFVLNNLREGDLFNVVAYDSEVESFRPELQKYNDRTREEALAFVDGIYAGGSTAIDAALKTSLSMIQDDSRPGYIVFLTDGKPTAGETNEMKIVANARKVNQKNARLISLGVGYDVNSRLLDRLTSENRGQSEFVRPDEDIETHVSRLYNRIAAPLLGDVRIDYLFDEVSATQSPVNRIYPKKVFELFAGQQLVVVGRYKKAGPAKIRISGKVGEKKQKFSFPARFSKKSSNESNSFVEKLWAMRRIGEIIDEVDLKGKNDELINELIGLSTRHGILTPYTSFLADDQASSNRLTDGRQDFERTRNQLIRLKETGGRAGFAQRSLKQRLKVADQLQSAQLFSEDFAAPDIDSKVPGGNSPAGVQKEAAEAFKKAIMERMKENRSAQSFGGRGSSGGEALGLQAGNSTPRPGNQPASGGGKAAAGISGNGAIINDIDSDKKLATDSAQVIGKNTIYRRGQMLIDASAKDVDLTRDKKLIREVKRFSSEYFELTGKNSKSENAVLAFQKDSQQLLIRLRGQIYLIR